jgi:hypothetical protein
MPLADASELRSVFDPRSTVKEASLATTPWSMGKNAAAVSGLMSIWRASQAVSQFERVYAVALDPRPRRGRCGGLSVRISGTRADSVLATAWKVNSA